MILIPDTRSNTKYLNTYRTCTVGQKKKRGGSNATRFPVSEKREALANGSGAPEIVVEPESLFPEFAISRPLAATYSDLLPFPVDAFAR